MLQQNTCNIYIPISPNPTKSFRYLVVHSMQWRSFPVTISTVVYLRLNEWHAPLKR